MCAENTITRRGVVELKISSNSYCSQSMNNLCLQSWSLLGCRLAYLAPLEDLSSIALLDLECIDMAGMVVAAGASVDLVGVRGHLWWFPSLRAY